MPNYVTTIVTTENNIDLQQIIKKLCDTTIPLNDLKPTIDTSNVKTLIDNSKNINKVITVDFENVIARPKTLNDVPATNEKHMINDIAIYLTTLSKKEQEEKIKKLNKLSIDDIDPYKFIEQTDFYVGNIVKSLIAKNKELDKNQTNKINGSIYCENLIKYECFTSHDWNIKNWGTNSNATESGITDSYLIFNTAWDTPKNILLKLSKSLPDINITILYADDNICGENYDHVILKNGKIHKTIDIKDSIFFSSLITGIEPY